MVITGAAELGKDAQSAVLGAARDLPPETVLVVQHTGGGRAKALVADLRKAGAEEHTAGKLAGPLDAVLRARTSISQPRDQSSVAKARSPGASRMYRQRCPRKRFSPWRLSQ